MEPTRTESMEESKTTITADDTGDDGTGLVDKLENVRETETTDKPQKLVEIRITEVQVRDGKLGSKHVVYRIKGKDQEGAFEIFRRYSDFDTLRELLLVRWPGTVIPPIPSKKSVGNMEAWFVKDRMKFLEAFLIRVSEMPHLYYSEEFQIFLKNPTQDLEKAFTSAKKVTTQEIVEKYQQLYPELAQKEVTSEHSTIIMNFQMSLIKMLAYFENFKKMSENVVQAKKNYYESLLFFRDRLMVDYERSCLAEYSFPNSTSMVFQGYSEVRKAQPGKKVLNSFEYIHDFIRITEKDIRTFIQAIEQREKLQGQKEKLIEKQRALGVELQGILSGKTSMTSLLTRKNKDTEIENCEKKIAETKRELELTSNLHDLITVILATHEIKVFKEKKLDRFYRLIRKAATNETTQLGEVRKIWTFVLEDETVKKSAKELG
eukprot:CAMPEP_0176452576 /NCGR_PEP_ID=MMETSP0127-20121128/28628_1 /TAXON_ID=938130 /ORGANISM="Platyophrya macrostoma, Strain WH" /LENGTH=432 /DNA_ID=CAMNT_0017841077 /DNA_START=19 /DNA_END=1313 /DNA_ORIENTATION=-